MASLNKVMIIGRLGADPETRTAGGHTVASLRVATDESYTDRNGQRVDKAEWHSVSVWDKDADNCGKFLHKGSMVYIEGRLSTRKWQDQNGQNRYTTEIRADRVQFLDPRENSQQKPAQGRNPAPSESYGGTDEIPF